MSKNPYLRTDMEIASILVPVKAGAAKAETLFLNLPTILPLAAGLPYPARISTGIAGMLNTGLSEDPEGKEALADRTVDLLRRTNQAILQACEAGGGEQECPMRFQLDETELVVDAVEEEGDTATLHIFLASEAASEAK